MIQFSINNKFSVFSKKCSDNESNFLKLNPPSFKLKNNSRVKGLFAKAFFV